MTEDQLLDACFADATFLAAEANCQAVSAAFGPTSPATGAAAVAVMDAMNDFWIANTGDPFPY